MSQAKRHLYVALRDYENGYTVRRIDVDTFDAGGGPNPDEHPEPLPEPPAFVVEAEHGHPTFAALGARILAMPRSAAGAGAPPGFDAAAAAAPGLVIAPPPQGGDHRPPTLVAVGGDRVYGLGCSTRAGGGEARHFEVLHAPAPPRRMRWAWSAVPAPPRRMRWAWSAVPAPPPFNPLLVTCHAAHPDGRAVFFSAEASSSGSGSGGGTFSFDTKRLEWTCHGAWLLPFAGQAHYDRELDAWAGLCGRHHGDAGRVASCDVVDPDKRRSPAPAWKLGAQPVLCEDKRRHVGAALVYCGDSRFCLLECVEEKNKKKNAQERHGPPPDQPRRLLHVTAFGLKYGKRGELTTTMRRQRRCYALPDGAANFMGKPVAFWM